jgi:hypothetical protein
MACWWLCLAQGCCLQTLGTTVMDYDMHHPPTTSYQRLRAAETACHVMSAKELDERLQRLSTSFSVGIAWSDLLTNRASWLAGRSNVRKRDQKRKKKDSPRHCLLRLNRYRSPWRSDASDSQQSMTMGKCIRVYVLGGRSGWVGLTTANGG